MNTTSDGSPVVTGDENEQKTISGLDELLEQELKEDDSVDCFIKRKEDDSVDSFIKRVGETSEDSSEFGLNYDEAPVVSNSAFYSPKEETSTDKNSSSLEKEFEVTLNKSKEVSFASAADKLQSGEETKDDTLNTNTSEEDADGCAKEMGENGKDDMLNKHGLDSVQNQGDERSKITKETDSEKTDQINKEHNIAEDTIKGKEAGNDVHVSVKVKLSSEITNGDTEQNEKDTDNQTAKSENTTEVRKDILFLVFQPKDQVSQKNDSEKDNENKETVQCSEKSTVSASITTSNTSPDNPINKTVFTIASNNEPKNAKEINKSIIVKKITAKIIKNVNTGTSKPATESEVNDHASGEENHSTTKSSELEENQQCNKLDITAEEPETGIQNEDAASEKTSKPNIIITKKVYGNSKKTPKVLQEKQVSTTEDGEAPKVDKQGASNTGEDKGLVLEDNVKLLRKTRVFSSNEGKTSPRKKSDECTKKPTTNFGAVKRKFEEICRISREEEDAAMEEIKKMKQESLDVLKKINAEMEKLKLVFLAGK